MTEKTRISADNLAPLVAVAIPTRVCFGVLVDMPKLYCAGWLAVALGGLLALPVAFCASKCTCSRWGAAIFALCALYDGAAMLRALAHTAEYAASGETSAYLLMLPVLVFCGFCLWNGGNAIGGAARIWTRVLPVLLIIVIACEFQEFRVGWLFPVLGSGVGSVFDGTVSVAGWIALPSALYMTAQPDPRTRRRPWSPVKITIVCTALSAALVALHGLMTPPLVNVSNLSRFFLLDTVLSNGRAPLSLQLPMSVLAFAGLLTLELFDLLSIATMLEICFLSWKKIAVIALALIPTAFLAMSPLCFRENVSQFARWAFLLESAAVLGQMAVSKGRGFLA